MFHMKHTEFHSIISNHVSCETISGNINIPAATVSTKYFSFVINNFEIPFFTPDIILKLISLKMFLESKKYSNNDLYNLHYPIISLC